MNFRIAEMTTIVTLTANLLNGGLATHTVQATHPIANKEQHVVIHKFKPNDPMELEVVKPTAKQELELQNEEAKKIEKQKSDFKRFVDVIRYNDTTEIDLRKPSGLTSDLANEILKGTGLEGLGEAFVNSEKKYGVNAYYLMAHAAWESKWGKSKLARTKNNLFGFLAYDADPYNSAKSFSSKAESIDVVAKYISENYLNSNGKHYNGPTLDGINVKYATDKSWARGIGNIIDKFVLELADLKGV